MCLDAGVDNIGVALDTGFRCPREVDLKTLHEIFDFIGDKAKKVLIIVSKDEEPVLKYVKELRPDIIHICGNEYEATPELKKKLLEIDPNIELMQAIGIPTPDMMKKAKYFITCHELASAFDQTSVIGINELRPERLRPLLITNEQKKLAEAEKQLSFDFEP